MTEPRRYGSPRTAARNVVLMDLRMPGAGGIAATADLRERAPAARVLVLTTYADQDAIVPALQAGARGYLTKDASAEQIETAIRAVHAGQTQLDPPGNAWWPRSQGFTEPRSPREEHTAEPVLAARRKTAAGPPPRWWSSSPARGQNGPASWLRTNAPARRGRAGASPILPGSRRVRAAARAIPAAPVAGRRGGSASTATCRPGCARAPAPAATPSPRCQG